MHIYIRNALFSPPTNILCISNVCCITNTCVLVYQSEINRPNPGIQIRGSQPPVMRPAALAQGRYKKKLQNKREKKKDFVFPARRTCMLNGSNEGIPTTYPDCVFFCFCFQGGHIKKKTKSLLLQVLLLEPQTHVCNICFFIKSLASMDVWE